MMPKFVELHWHGIPASINVDSIAMFKDHEFLDCEGNCHEIDESYEDVKKLVTDSGYLIHKVDPRIDNKPLTMDDLKDMIGEPVWNSNTGRWMLVNRIDDVEGIDFAILTESDGIGYDFGEAMLKANPMYRMKQNE